MSAAPTVSVLIVSYNTRELTLACLESLFADSTADAYQVIVVDNASHDDSAGAIRADWPGVELIESSRNLGFAGGMNLAAEHARGGMLLLLNPDTRVLDGAIERLLRLADEHPEAGIYGGVTVGVDGEPDGASCWNRPTLWSALCQGLGLSALFRGSAWFDPQVAHLAPGSGAQEVDIVSGCFLLIRRSLWRELDGFDPAFFMYGEDFDLSLRGRARGARPLIAPDARIVHHGGASERDDGDRLVRLLGSHAKLFDRHASRRAARLGKATLWLWALTRRIAYSVGARVRPGLSGEADAWREVWRRRREFLDVPPPEPKATPAAPAR